MLMKTKKKKKMAKIQNSRFTNPLSNFGLDPLSEHKSFCGVVKLMPTLRGEVFEIRSLIWSHDN